MMFLCRYVVLSKSSSRGWFDRVGLAADPRREVLPPSVVEPRHLGQSCGLSVGDAVAEL
jgi:hypothetical protein